MTSPAGSITLRGSAAIVSEFFEFALNSILYQRGIFPEESFSFEKKYGLRIMLCNDQTVKDYLKKTLAQFSEWLVSGDLKRLVLVVSSQTTHEVLERWTFIVETDKAILNAGGQVKEKTEKEIVNEIRHIFMQITSNVTFLPLLEDKCTFDVLAYTCLTSDIPANWEESDARLINNSQVVKLRSFSTTEHQVKTLVSFKSDDLF